MRVAIEIREQDLRQLLFDKLTEQMSDKVTTNFGMSNFEAKMTWGEKETWRKPKYIRFVLDQEVDL